MSISDVNFTLKQTIVPLLNFFATFCEIIFCELMYNRASPDINRNSPSKPLTTILAVLFKPVPLSMYPKSFFVDNPFTALISASQSLSMNNLHF